MVFAPLLDQTRVGVDPLGGSLEASVMEIEAALDFVESVMDVAVSVTLAGERAVAGAL